MNLDIQIGKSVHVHTSKDNVKNLFYPKESLVIESLVSSLLMPRNTASSRVSGVDYIVRVRDTKGLGESTLARVQVPSYA